MVDEPCGDTKALVGHAFFQPGNVEKVIAPKTFYFVVGEQRVFSEYFGYVLVATIDLVPTSKAFFLTPGMKIDGSWGVMSRSPVRQKPPGLEKNNARDRISCRIPWYCGYRPSSTAVLLLVNFFKVTSGKATVRLDY